MKVLHAALFLTLLFSIAITAQQKNTYSYTGMDGVVIADSNSFYYEEFDTLGRPVTGVRWVDDTIAEQTNWQYYGETQDVRFSVKTAEDRITEIAYDRQGNIIKIREVPVPDDEKDAEDTTRKHTPKKADVKVTERVLTYSYDENNRLREAVTQEGTVLKTVQYDYRDDGSLLEKRVLKNRVLQIRYTYKDEENWTETVYSNDVVILTVLYRDGERQRINYETW